MNKPRERYKIGLELLGPTEGLKVLDAGCGFGIIGEYINVIGIDQSAYNLGQALKKTPCAKLAAAHLENMPFPEKYFEAVIMLETLEHVRDEDACLEEIGRVSKDNAKLVLSVPNDRLLYNIIDLERWFIPLVTGRPVHRHYKKDALVKKLSEHGFAAEKIFERGLIFSALARWFVFCFDMIDRAFFGGFNGPFGRTIRRLFDPLVDLEFRIPTRFGHSLFLQAKKQGG